MTVRQLNPYITLCTLSFAPELFLTLHPPQSFPHRRGYCFGNSVVFDLLVQTIVVFQSLCIQINNLRAFLQLFLFGGERDLEHIDSEGMGRLGE